tara:strand:+ start:206 stop:739 length:534 start_codon:yes stop_codon:yes gene_type:complete
LKKNKAFFFDRDGILNKVILKKNKPYSPRYPKQVVKNYEILKLIKLLKKKKFKKIIITNQPDIKTGKLTKHSLRTINNDIKLFFSIDDIFVCTHNKFDKCHCRKPKIGMIKLAEKKWNLDLKKSYLIGDRWKDIDAGNKAGCKTIYIDYNYDEKKPKKPIYSFKSLTQMLCQVEKII